MLKNVFEENAKLEIKFLEKIVQTRIVLPPIEKITKEELFTKALQNVVEFYVKEKLDNAAENWLSIIASKLNNVRELKLFINGSLSHVLPLKTGLYLRDLLFIEFIKTFNSKLYFELMNNEQFLVSVSRELSGISMELEYIERYFSKEATAAFKMLFADKLNDQYADMLCDLFPMIKQYRQADQLRGDTDNINYACNSSGLGGERICDGRYFNLFFSLSDNLYSEMDKNVAYLIHLFNTSTDDVNIATETEKCLKKYKENLDDIYSFIYNKLDGLNPAGKKRLEKILYDNYAVEKLGVEKSNSGWPNNLRYNATIIAEMIKGMDKEELQTILNNRLKDYNKLSLFNYVRIEFKNFSDSKNKKILYEFLKNIVYDVINNKINLYDVNNYSRYNILGFYELLKTIEGTKELKEPKELEEDSDTEFMNYLNAIVTLDNIHLLIGDLIAENDDGTIWRLYVEYALFDKIRKGVLDKIITREIKSKDRLQSKYLEMYWEILDNPDKFNQF